MISSVLQSLISQFTESVSLFSLFVLVSVSLFVLVPLQIENHDSCVYDFLEFRDGHDEDSRVIGKHCGYKIPQGVKSTGNKLWVRFKSDGSVQKPGFAAKFLKGVLTESTR